MPAYYFASSQIAEFMVICIEVEQRTKNELDQLLKVGGYKDYSQAVAVAISNQVLLQHQVNCDRQSVCHGWRRMSRG